MSEEIKEENVPQTEGAPEEKKSEKAPKEKKSKPRKDKKAEKIAALEEELEKKKDEMLRLAAEYGNYRRRTEQEKLRIYGDATAKAVEELLPVADSLTMAMQNLKNAPEEFVKGLELVQTQLTASLSKLKVEEFCEVGDDFDPNIHNAIARIDSEDLGKNKIAAVFQKGYRIGDKIIRHAMVQVANCD